MAGVMALTILVTYEAAAVSSKRMCRGQDQVSHAPRAMINNKTAKYRLRSPYDRRQGVKVDDTPSPSMLLSLRYSLRYLQMLCGSSRSSLGNGILLRHWYEWHRLWSRAGEWGSWSVRGNACVLLNRDQQHESLRCSQ